MSDEGRSFGAAPRVFPGPRPRPGTELLRLAAATHSFELMLSAFILGLAAGSLFIRRKADSVRPLGALALIQWLMGSAALLTLPVYMASFGWTASLVGALEATRGGYFLYNLGRYGLALAVMLPSTFCAGMTLPLITRTMLVGPRGERAIGWVYGVNTVGSIVGVVLASLVLLPLVGLKGLLVVGALLDMLLGVWLVALADRRRGAGQARTGSVLVATMAVSGRPSGWTSPPRRSWPSPHWRMRPTPVGPRSSAWDRA